jgi:chromosome segregation ATPase
MAVQRQEVQDMARGAVIEADELFETADRLAAEGKEVTAISLHKALGRGSLTTIYRYLETWKSKRPAKASTTTAAEVPEVVKTAFAGVWRVAAQEAAREVEGIKIKAQEEVKEALSQFHSALADMEKLESDNEAAAAEIDALKKQAAEDQEKITRLEADSAGHKATAEGQRQELERLHSELERQRTERDEALKEAAELRGRAEVLQKQNDQLLAKLPDQ